MSFYQEETIYFPSGIRNSLFPSGQSPSGNKLFQIPSGNKTVSSFKKLKDIPCLLQERDFRNTHIHVHMLLFITGAGFQEHSGGIQEDRTTLQTVL